RVERCHRLLEDHGNVIAAHRAHRRLVKAQQIAALEPDRAADDPAGRRRHETHERERGHALATAGFADDGQRLAAPQRERHAVDRLDGAVANGELGAEPLDVEHRACRHQRRSLGSSRSRNASPRRLVPNTTRLMAMPGNTTSQGAVRTYSAADSDSMRPQEGCGSGMPRPRKESDASVRMAEPSWAVASTMSGASVLGRTWRSAMRSSLMPTARAASTKGNSRSARVLARMT